MSTISPSTARRTFRSAEPIHGMVYFTPYGREEYAALGIMDPRMGYFASRSAPMGAVAAGVTIATFFNFNPAVIRRAIPAAWEIASPAKILEARLQAVDRSLRQAWGDDVEGDAVQEAAALARTAAEHAGTRPQGKPLFAAHADLPWPDEPHLALWHAQSLLREFRGDGHVALLHAEGLTGLEALVVHSATGEIPAATLRTSRGWSEEDWSAGVESVRARGWLEDGPNLALNDAGRANRQSVEDRTDELAAYAYEAIGEDGCARFQELARPLTQAVVTGDLGFPEALSARYTRQR